MKKWTAAIYLAVVFGIFAGSGIACGYTSGCMFKEEEPHICEDNDGDHNCDGCGEVIPCGDFDDDHLCDICYEKISDCIDEDGDNTCDICFESLECIHEDENSDHLCDICEEVLSECKDENSDHLCDVCGVKISGCVDEDGDAMCDICDKLMSNEIPEGEIIESDVGGVFDQALVGEFKNHYDTIKAEVDEITEMPIVYVEYDGNWHKAFPWVTCDGEKIDVGGRGTRFFVESMEEHLITYYIEVGGVQEVAKTKVTVEDTQGPTFNLPASADGMLVFKDKAVALPDWTAYDFNGVEGGEKDGVTVKVTYNGTDVAVQDGKITPTQFGEYVVTYTAKDTLGNEGSVSFAVECARMVELCDFDSADVTTAFQYFNGEETLGTLSDEFRYGDEGTSLKVTTRGVGDGGFIKVVAVPKYYVLNGFDEIAFYLWASDNLVGISSGIYLLNNRATSGQPINVKKGENILRFTMEDFSKDYIDGAILNSVPGSGNYNSSDHIYLQFRGPEGVDLYIDNLVGIFYEEDGADTSAPIVSVGAGAEIAKSAVYGEDGSAKATYKGIYGNISAYAGEPIKNAIERNVYVCDNSMEDVTVEYTVTKNGTDVTSSVMGGTEIGIEGTKYALTVKATDKAGNETTETTEIVVRHNYPTYNPNAEGFRAEQLNNFTKATDVRAEKLSLTVALRDQIDKVNPRIEVVTAAENETMYVSLGEELKDAEIREMSYVHLKVFSGDAGPELSLGDVALCRVKAGWNDITIDSATLLKAKQSGAYANGELKINIYCPLSISFKLTIFEANAVYMDGTIVEPVEPTQLATPVVTLDGNMAKWDAVANASGYTVYIDGEEKETITELSYTLEDGEKITVVAVGDGVFFLDSEASVEKEYNAPEQLTAPVVTLVGNVATWEEVENATGYVYIINDGEETEATQFSVTLADGDTFKVKAIGDGEAYVDSAWSNAVSFTKGTLEAPVAGLDGNKAVWNDVENAEGYVYVINDGEETEATELYVTLADGDTFKVKAIGNELYNDSAWSNEVEFTVGQLTAPVVTLDGNVASWETIDGAQGYVVTVNGEAQDMQTTLNYTMADGDTITVVAIGDGTYLLDSEPSDEVSFAKKDLAAPVVTLDDNVASWEEVENATGYIVTVNGEAQEMQIETSYEMTAGTKLTVKAVGNEALYNDSVASNAVVLKGTLTPPEVTLEDNVASWEEVENATGYIVTVNGEAQEMQIETSYEMTAGTKLTVKAVGNAELFDDSAESNEVILKGTLAAPVVTREGNVAVGYKATWAKVDNAIGYIVYVNGEEKETITELSYAMTAGTKLTVKAVGDGVLFDNGAASNEVIWKGKLAAPEEVTLDGNVAKWTEVANATGYIVTVNGEAQPVQTATEYALVDGDTITVVAVGDGVLFDDSEESGSKKFNAKALAKPTVTFGEGDDANVASWTAVDGATGYTVYINGEEKETITELSYTLVDGEKITVKAISTNVLYKAESAVSVEKTFTKKTLATPAVEISGNEASWDMVEGAKEYVIYINGEVVATQTGTTYPISEGQKIVVKAVGKAEVYNPAESEPDVLKGDLEAPVITLSGNVATWTAVANATCYVYIINNEGEGTQVDEPTTVALNDGDTITVKAIGGELYNDSEAERLFEADKLSDVIVTLGEGDKANVATWTAVDNATGYEYKINGGDAVKVDEPLEVTLTDGDTITVKAVGVGAYKDGDWSSPVTFAKQDLAAPVVTLDGDVAKWDAVANATEYVIYVNGEEVVKQAETSYAMTAGTKLTVKAVGNEALYNDSAESNAVVLKGTLAAPVVTLEDNVATWTAVANATEYVIYVNGEEFATQAENSYEMTAGTKLTVKAVGDAELFDDSVESNEVVLKGDLAKPEVTLNGYVASWTEVANATSYILTVNGEDTTVEATVLSVELNDGETLTVVAIGSELYNNSNSSDAVTFNATKLGAPNVTLDKNIASWTAVEHATGYTYKINEDGVENTTTTLDEIELSDGDTLYVKATSTDKLYKDSDWATSAKFVKGTLDKPVVTLDGNVASWARVSNATDYIVYVNDEVVATEKGAIKYEGLTDGDKIQVVAVGNEKLYNNSEKSDVVTFTAEELAAPVVELNDNVASWTAVDGATGYVVYIGGVEKATITELSYALVDGETITVKAISTSVLYKTESAISNPVTFTATKLGTPVVTFVGTNATWEAVANATGYEYKINGGEAQKTADTSVTVAAGDEIEVRAITDNVLYKASDWSAAASFDKLTLAAPVVVLNDNVASWGMVNGATSYIVYINDVETATITENSYTLVDGDKIQVVAIGDEALYNDSTKSNAVTFNATKLGAPVAELNGNVASWAIVDNATEYVIYVDGAEVARQDNNNRSYVLSDGQTLKVVAVSSSVLYKDSDDSNEVTFTKGTLAAPVVTLDGRTASWTAVDGATSYIYKIGEDGEEKTTAGTSVTLTDGQTIYVKAIGNETLYNASDWSTAVTFNATKLSAPVVTLGAGDKANVATWTAVANASGYVYKIGDVETEVDAPIEVTLISGQSIQVKVRSGDLLYKDSDYSAAVTFTATKLTAPTLSRDGYNVTWADVANATGYAYKVGADGAEKPVTDNKVSIADGQTIYVKATTTNPLYADSDWADITLNLIKVATPNVTQNGSVLTWEAVANASGYVYQPENDATGTEFKLDGATMTLTSGQSVRIRAKGDLNAGYADSDWSGYFSYKETLAAPTVTLSGNVASWDAVTNATGYIVTLNGAAQAVQTERTFTLTNAGDKITVQAVNSEDKYNASAQSNEVTFTATKLSAPSISLSGKVVSWAAVANATEYVIYVDGTEVATQSATSYTMTQQGTVQVKAVGDGTVYTNSDLSNEVTLTGTQIAAPVISITDNVVSWSGVTNATAYEVWLDGIAQARQSSTSYIVSTTVADIKVMAIGDGVLHLDSELSNSVSYTSSSVQGTLLNNCDVAATYWLNPVGGTATLNTDAAYIKQGSASIKVVTSTGYAQIALVLRDYTNGDAPLTWEQLQQYESLYFNVYYDSTNGGTTAQSADPINLYLYNVLATNLVHGWNEVLIPMTTIQEQYALSTSQFIQGEFFLATGAQYTLYFDNVMGIGNNSSGGGTTPDPEEPENPGEGGSTTTPTAENVLNAMNSADFTTNGMSSITTTTANSVDGTSVVGTIEAGGSWTEWYIPLKINGAVPTLAQLGALDYIEVTVYVENAGNFQMYRTQVAQISAGKNVIRIPGSQFVQIANTWTEAHGGAKAYDETTGVVNFNIAVGESASAQSIWVDNIVIGEIEGYSAISGNAKLVYNAEVDAENFQWTIVTNAAKSFDKTTFVQGSSSLKLDVAGGNYLNFYLVDYTINASLGQYSNIVQAWMTKETATTFIGGISMDVYNASATDITMNFSDNATAAATLTANAWTRVTFTAEQVATWFANDNGRGYSTFFFANAGTIYIDNVVVTTTRMLNDCSAAQFWVDSNVTGTVNTDMAYVKEGTTSVKITANAWNYMNVYARQYVAGNPEVPKATLASYDYVSMDIYNASGQTVTLYYSDQTTLAMTLADGAWTTVTFDAAAINTWFGEGFCMFYFLGQDGVTIYVDNVIGVKNV